MSAIMRILRPYCKHKRATSVCCFFSIICRPVRVWRARAIATRPRDRCPRSCGSVTDILFSPSVQIGSRTHPASCSKSTRFFSIGRLWRRDIHLLPKLRVRGGILPLSHTSSWRGQGLFYLHFLSTFPEISKSDYQLHNVRPSVCMEHNSAPTTRILMKLDI